MRSGGRGGRGISFVMSILLPAALMTAFRPRSAIAILRRRRRRRISAPIGAASSTRSRRRRRRRRRQRSKSRRRGIVPKRRRRRRGFTRRRGGRRSGDVIVGRRSAAGSGGGSSSGRVLGLRRAGNVADADVLIHVDFGIVIAASDEQGLLNVVVLVILVGRSERTSEEFLPLGSTGVDGPRLLRRLTLRLPRRRHDVGTARCAGSGSRRVLTLSAAARRA